LPPWSGACRQRRSGVSVGSGLVDGIEAMLDGVVPHVSQRPQNGPTGYSGSSG
jgi:hypothetical protein